MPESEAGKANSGLLNLRLTAVGSGREIELGALPTPALLICFGQETQAGIEAIENATRERYPAADQLLVAHVVDLHKVPSLLRKVAEGVLSSEHKKAVANLPPGAVPDDHVIILPDWKGDAVRTLGLEDATRVVGLALIDRTGQVVWRHQGTDPAGALHERLTTSPL
jgi:hypothetical protein